MPNATNPTVLSKNFFILVLQIILLRFSEAFSSQATSARAHPISDTNHIRFRRKGRLRKATLVSQLHDRKLMICLGYFLTCGTFSGQKSGDFVMVRHQNTDRDFEAFPP
jgi:hypothetical protein